ncbi:MAG: hypothetical protein NTW16_13445 [Bacteroidetes bacterium]|nr:hypothetical protein [Bacteroidota bacterium]
MIGIILIIIGPGLLLTGIVIFRRSSRENKQRIICNETRNLVELVIADGVLTKNEKEAIRKIANEKTLNYDEIILEIEEKLQRHEIEAETEVIDQCKKNGNDFEKYIAQKFNKKYFKIREWAGDKYVNGVYAQTTLNPDILLEFNFYSEKTMLAVECKWRKNTNNNWVEFAKKDQIDRYKKLEQEKKIPVFIAIGINGNGSHPEHLYMVPLKCIKTSFLHIENLQKFEIKHDRNFFFDVKNERLN